MTENKIKPTISQVIYCLKAECERYPEVCEECQLYGEVGCDHCYDDVTDMAIKFLKELERYRAIGTVEEFKALKEKNEPKKPNKSGVTDSNGVFHAINGINGVPYDLCPNCEINLCTDGMFGGNRDGMKYCKNCGQKLDWRE